MNEKTKMCRGHFHAPGTELPLSEFYIHQGKWRHGKPFAKCKQCNIYQQTHPAGDPEWNVYVPMTTVRPLVSELRRRIGPTEAARRAGLYTDLLTKTRISKMTKGMRQSTVDKLQAVLDDARARGEDNFDVNNVRRANLVAGGVPGAREKAVEAMQQKWADWRALPPYVRLSIQRHRKPKMERARRLAHAKAHAKLTRKHQEMNRVLVKRQEVDMTPPDKTWWHFTGQEWLPRYGEEMLGKEF